MSLLKFVKNNNINKAMELLQGTSNLLEIDESTNKTIFHYAVQYNNLQLLSALLEKAFENQEIFDLNKEDVYGYTPLMLSIDNSGNDIAIFDLLLKYIKDVNYKTNLHKNRTSIHVAAEANNIHYLEKLLEHKADINSICTEGTALHIAIRCSSIENSLFLLGKPEISLKEIDENGDSPLHLSIKEGLIDVFMEICKKILGESYDGVLNMKNSEGNTPLHLSVLYKRSTCESYLRQKFVAEGKLDIMIKNKEGKTADNLKNEMEEEEKREKLAVLEKKKMNSLRSKEKQELKRRENVENEKKLMKEKEDDGRKHKLIEEEKEKGEIKGRVYAIAVILIMLIGMYYAFRYLGEKKRDNYLD